ncbi:MAG TPA: glycosyltransferase, partial [Flavitalea sp.]|nr:glycosyltransferase [Flavitalea sp.]
IFISRIHPIKNLDYLLSILPELDMKIQLTIVGAIEDKVYWQHCHNLISLIDRKVSIIIKEDVPHAQLESMIIGHHLFVLPTLGENFGHAIFESLAAGRPVLISDQTPWRNLVIHHAGWDIALTDRSQFKEVIKSIANMDATELNVWCKAAWMYCQSYLSINDFKKEYKELFASKN